MVRTAWYGIEVNESPKIGSPNGEEFDREPVKNPDLRRRIFEITAAHVAEELKKRNKKK